MPNAPCLAPINRFQCRNGPSSNAATTESVGDLVTLLLPFERPSGRPTSLDKAIATYGEAAHQLPVVH